MTASGLPSPIFSPPPMPGWSFASLNAALCVLMLRELTRAS
jgi:hypothetical protein